MRSSYFVAAVLVAACSGASPAPSGWHPVAGSNAQWERGVGGLRQTYAYSRSSYSGMLPDLASQVTVVALLQHPGAKLEGANVPFAPCPGMAGVATFRLRAGKVLQEGFAVRDGRAIRTEYVRPAATPADPNVTAAMQNVLC